MAGVEHHIFDSVEAAAESLGKLWRADIVQMDAGPMRIDVRAAAVGSCGVTEVSTTRKLVSSGVRRDDVVTITPITPANAAGRYRGRQLAPGTLLVLDPGGEAVQQAPAAHRQMSLSIPLQLLRRVARVDLGSDGDRFLRWQALRPSSQAFSKLLHAIRMPLDGKFRGDGSTDGDQRLTALVLGALADMDVTREVASAGRRRRIARQAEELMRADLGTPPSVLELCEAAGTSRRTLFYAFEELYGVTPAAFLKTLRLHEARRAIRATDDPGGIQLLARKLGFKHAGQFAIDYARAFGESPSMTARRSSRRPTS